MSTLNEFDFYLHAETASAVLVSDDDDEINAFWLPVKHIECRHDMKIGGVYTFGLPTWLASDRGLV